MASTELLQPAHCPFCGEPGAVAASDDDAWSVECQNGDCVVICATIEYGSRDAAVQAWNYRKAAER
jgi:hypothetical protein